MPVFWFIFIVLEKIIYADFQTDLMPWTCKDAHTCTRAHTHTHKQTPRPSKKNTTSEENMKTHGLCVLALAIVCMFCLESVQTWTDHHGARCPSHRTEWCGDTAAWTVISRHFRDFLQACCCWCRRLGATRGPKRVFVGGFFLCRRTKKKCEFCFSGNTNHRPKLRLLLLLI